MIDDFRSVGPDKPAAKLKPTPVFQTNSEPSQPFETPQQVAQHHAFGPYGTLPADDTPPRGSGHHWFNLPWPPNRQEVILAAVIAVLALGGLGVYARIIHKSTVTKPVAAVVKPVKAEAAEKPALVSSFSGLPISDAAVNQRPIVSVMVENSTEARPQSGLSQAGFIFEAIAEGGITRLMAVYQDQQPTTIGPVRSARPYFVQWNEGFRGAYAHVGGSADALSDIKAWNVQDMNQFYNSGPYHRVSSRSAPHNMYSSVVDLAALASQKGFTGSGKNFARKTATPAGQPTATSIDLSISSAAFNSHYAYDQASNSYLRSEGGAPQLDANTAKQLAPNVVIAMVVPVSPGGKTAQGGSYSDYNPLGSGQATVFQDGTATAVTWHKATNTDQLSFTDAGGAVVKLNPGQTWITALASASKLSYH